MSHHEQEKRARDRRTAKILNDIADEIHDSRHLVKAAFMASQDLPPDQSEAMATLLNIIGQKLKAAAAGIEAHVCQEGSIDAA